MFAGHFGLADFITHRPDLPLWPGGPKVGLGLWNSRPGTALVEGAIFFGGVGLYARQTRRNGRGRWALAAFAAFIAAIQLASYFGPPPPSVQAIAFAGLLPWVLPPWAHWVDARRGARHPQVVPGPGGSGPASGRASK